MFETIILILGSFYALVLLLLMVGLSRLRAGTSSATPFVSVIVAARNEALHIDRLLQCLTAQTYPNLEIIIANDRSTDETATLLEVWERKDARVRRIDVGNLPSTGFPAKKNALAHAINASHGDILCFTDADCAPPPQWVTIMAGYFDSRVGLVAGFSPYERIEPDGKGSAFWQELLYRFVRFEEFKAALWSAGSIALGKGWLCTGRNLAFRRVIFDEVGGYEQIKHSISGDDDLFLQLIRTRTTWEVRYATSVESHVPTLPPASFKEFLEQRKRHFSAAKYFPLSMKLFFFIFHFANFAIVTAFLVWIAVPSASLFLFFSFLMKTLADLSILTFGGKVIGQNNVNVSFLLFEILYVLYNTFVGPLGLFRKFEWKPELK